MSARLGKTLASALALGSPLLAVGSCASSGDGRSTPDAGTGTYARLNVTVTVPRESGGSVAASARLLRYRGVDVDSAQVLAGTPEAGRAAGVVPGCQLVDDEALLDDALATSPPDASVQMLDAGDLLIHIAGQTVKVSPRYVPEIVPFVSGVVYEAEAQAVDPIGDLPGREDAFVAAFGGQQIGRFSAPADVPPAPRIEAAVDSGEVSVLWSMDHEVNRGTVEIVIGGEVGPSLRCQVPDIGYSVISMEAMNRLRDGRTGPLAVSVERTRHTPFSAPGLENGELTVTVRDVVTLK